MSMIIQHNMQAMNSSRMLGIVTGQQRKSTEKLSSGYKINRAADDAAGLSISEKMRKKIRGLNRGKTNTMDGVSFVQVGDGAMGQVADMIQRMNVLAIQAANGTNSDSDREAIQSEISHLKTEIDRINDTTKFNEMNVFLPDEDEQPQVELSVSGTPDTHSDLNYFTGDDGKTPAGVIFHGRRIQWSDIDADLYDPATKTFKKGSYTWEWDGTPKKYEDNYKDPVYADPKKGKYYLNFTVAKDGTKLPTIDRQLKLSADTGGIYVDGEYYEFSGDPNYKYLNSADGVDSYQLNYHGMKLLLNFLDGDDPETMAKAIGFGGTKEIEYEWHEMPAGKESDVAVNVSGGGTMTVDNTFNTADKLKQFDIGKTITVHADDSGIWLDCGGTEVANSKKSWEDLLTIAPGTNTDPDNDIQTGVTDRYEKGIKDSDWTSEQRITAHDDASFQKYRYYYMDDKGGTFVNFSFSVADNISKPELIKGLNGLTVTSGLSNNYTASVTKDANVRGPFELAVTTNGASNFLTFDQENAFGRDFSDATHTLPTTGKIKDDWSTTGGATLEFSGGGQTLDMKADGSQVTRALSNIRTSQIDWMSDFADSALEQMTYTYATDATGRKVRDASGTFGHDSANMDFTFANTNDGSKSIHLTGKNGCRE